MDPNSNIRVQPYQEARMYSTCATQDTPAAALRRQEMTRMGDKGAAGHASAAGAGKPARSANRHRSKRGQSATKNGSPEMVQLLTPEGERRDSALDTFGNEYTVDFTDEEYRGFYRDMVVIRKLDTEAEALQRQGELGIWASLRGQEAAQVGSGRALQPQDMAFPTYREHGVLYCRGIDPIMPLGLFRGVDQGGWDPNKFKFHMYTIVIGAQTLHATGYAMGITKDGKVGGDDGEAVIAYFGDGATSQGDVNESFVWASVYQSPIVFFCQNNQYAISEPIERQTRVPLYQRAAGFGFPGVRVDGNDVLATWAVTRTALDRARRGEGPTLIEAYTYRMGAHTTSDDPTRYRLASELEEWQARDPIQRLRTFLTNQKLADDDFFAQVDEEAQAAASDLRQRVLAMPDPPPEKMFDHVYPHGSPELDKQREQFLAYAASFEGGAH
jgi:2-oxoisovalerate dehydrogenase E1 component alpha subunit